MDGAHFIQVGLDTCLNRSNQRIDHWDFLFPIAESFSILVWIVSRLRFSNIKDRRSGERYKCILQGRRFDQIDINEHSLTVRNYRRAYFVCQVPHRLLQKLLRVTECIISTHNKRKKRMVWSRGYIGSSSIPTASA